MRNTVLLLALAVAGFLCAQTKLNIQTQGRNFPAAPAAGGMVVGTGPSGALAFDPASQTVDINTAIMPRKTAANSWTGRNDFTYLQVDATNTAPPCAVAADIGGIWIDSTDPNNTAYRVCLAVSGTIHWVGK